MKNRKPNRRQENNTGRSNLNEEWKKQAGLKRKKKESKKEKKKGEACLKR
jgi:hypothetical protein